MSAVTVESCCDCGSPTDSPYMVLPAQGGRIRYRRCSTCATVFAAAVKARDHCAVQRALLRLYTAAAEQFAARHRGPRVLRNAPPGAP